MEGARPAATGDLAELARLWRAALDELDGQRGGGQLASGLRLPEPLGESLRPALGDAGRRVVVGTVDGAVVGFGLARVDERGTTLGVVEALYVEPGARRIGVGEAILDSIAAWSKQHGCAGIDAPALPGNREAKGFFETHGFTARLLVMHRELGERVR